MTDVKEDKNAQLYALPSNVAFWWKISPPPSVDTNAQMRMAIQAMGTMVLFAINSHLSLFGCMHRKGI